MKKSRSEVSEDVEETRMSEAPQPPATILKLEGLAAVSDETSILEQMTMLGEELDQEKRPVVSDSDETGVLERMTMLEDDHDQENMAVVGDNEDALGRSERDLIQERLLDTDDEDEEDEDGPNETLEETNIEIKEECRTPEEHLSESIKTLLTKEIRIINRTVKANLRSKEIKLKSFEAKIRSLEAEKEELSTKYKKYKEMAVKLTKEKGTCGKSSGGGNKQLEEENLELKMNLKSVLDNLRNEEESNWRES